VNDLPAPALRLLSRQLDTATTQQLEAAGIGRKARQRLVGDHVLDRIGKGVYRTAGTRETLAHRMVALCLEHPSGFITGPTAGGVVGLRRMPRTSKVVFTAPHGQRVDLPNWVRLQQSTSITPDDVRRLDNGIVIAAWPRLAFDLSRDLTPRNLRSVIDQMLQMKVVDESQLVEIGRRLCARGRDGSIRYAHALLTRHQGRPVDSDPELVVLERLLRRGVPVVTQHELLELPNGRTARIDLAVPEIRWAIEIDIHTSHLLLTGTTSDKQRDRQLHLIGWQVERVTALDMLLPDTLCDELTTLYEARRVAFRP
jgi:very-short-patch-repair endonuclease